MKNQLLIITLVITQLFITKINFGQAPNLGAAASFTLFTEVGAFGNSGATNITGNIGTNSGAFTGFPPGTLTGTIHVADSISALAAIAVDTAYNQLGARTCDSTIGATLGNGQTLTSKVYCITTLATLSGNIYLNALGDSNAIFIFKINGALSTSTHSNVVMINSGLLRNVYWRINGAFTLGDTSIFRGTIIANGAISLLQGSSLFGRGLSKSGAIALHTNLNSLPVEILSFNANCNNQNVLIKWSTISEINNDYFSIERSNDGINFQIAGTIKGAGNSSGIKNYLFTDNESIKSVSYYRLKQTDFDGKFKYFNTVVVKSCGENISELDVYPNPVKGTLNLVYRGNQNELQSVSIYNMLGKKVYNAENFQSAIDLSDKPAGIYFLHFNSASKNIIKKLVIEK